MKLKIGDRVKLNKSIKDFRYGRGGAKYDEIGIVIKIEFNKLYIDFPSRMTSWQGLEHELVKVNITKEDLKNGDVVTLRNGDKLVLFDDVEFYDIDNKNNNELCVLSNLDDNLKFATPSGYKRKEYDIIKIERPIKYETIFERKKEILDDVEREYLNNLIKPFRKDVNYIQKVRYNENEEFIYIDIKNYEEISLPNFKKDSMYKGMERGKEYTLEELGLDKENE